MTYEEIADKDGLQGVVKERYIRYMKLRWADTEEEKCAVGYASDWAGRFKFGDEFANSDSFGQEILRKMYADDGAFKAGYSEGYEDALERGENGIEFCR